MLTDSIKEMKEALAAEEKEVDETAEHEEEKVEEEEKEPEKVEEEEKKEPEEKPDDSAFAKLRREAAAAKKRADDAEDALAAERNRKTEEAEEKEEEQPRIVPALERLILKQEKEDAEREFSARESKYAAGNPEYEAVTSQYTHALAQSIRLQNPRKSPAEIGELTKHAILSQAAQYIREGYDPIEEMFLTAKELGFTGKSSKKEEPKEEEEIRPDMKKLAANRKKSTGMGAANGKSEMGMSRAYIAQNGMPSVSEWKSLSKADKLRLMTSE